MTFCGRWTLSKAYCSMDWCFHCNFTTSWHSRYLDNLNDVVCVHDFFHCTDQWLPSWVGYNLNIVLDKAIHKIFCLGVDALTRCSSWHVNLEFFLVLYPLGTKLQSFSSFLTCESFCRLYWLTVNHSKSLFIPFGMLKEEVALCASELRTATINTLSFSYLGLIYLTANFCT